MNTLKNSVRLTGFLGSDPDVKKFGEGKSLARVSLATNEYHRNSSGEWITDTQWHNLTFWGKLAVFAGESLMKGSEIAIEGRLVNRSYADKDGVMRFVSEVVVNEVQQFAKKEKETVAS